MPLSNKRFPPLSMIFPIFKGIKFSFIWKSCLSAIESRGISRHQAAKLAKVHDGHSPSRQLADLEGQLSQGHPLW